MKIKSSHEKTGTAFVWKISQAKARLQRTKEAILSRAVTVILIIGFEKQRQLLPFREVLCISAVWTRRLF